MNSKVGENGWFGRGTILFGKCDFSGEVIKLKLPSLLSLLKLSREDAGSIDLGWKVEIVRRFAEVTLGAGVDYFLVFIVGSEGLRDQNSHGAVMGGVDCWRSYACRFK